MNKYIIKSGQNLYDIALAIYGSIEGIFDLLISNPSISYTTVFSPGMELSYHEDFILNQGIVTWLSDNDIVVKNGNYSIQTASVKTEILNWLKETNSQSFELDIVNSVDEWQCNVRPGIWYDEDEESISDTPATVDVVSSSVSSSAAEITATPSDWSDQQIETVNDDWITSAKENFNLDLSIVKSEYKTQYFDQWFNQGMILLPTDQGELDAYYINMATPKIKIVQSGSSLAINMQIPANKFIAIDWGDGTTLNFFHYQQKTIRTTHAYEDTGEHTILIYGHSEFVNLDFTNIKGIYYALSNVYIQQQFVTPYPEATTLNKLFTIIQK